MWSSLIAIVFATFLRGSVVTSQEVPNPTLTPTGKPSPSSLAPTTAPPSLTAPSTQGPSFVISRNECLVCKNTTLSIANPYATIEFPGTGVFSCYELFAAGTLGLFNSTFCTDVQDRVVERCNCTPSYPPVPAPSVNSPTRPPVVSFPPYPTAGFPVCYTCQTPGTQVEYIAFGYSVMDCFDPLKEHFGGFLDPGFCSLVNNDAKICNCHSGSVPAFVSVGFPACYVCKDSSLAVGKPNLVLTLPAQLPASCLELQNAGLEGFIDPTQCPYFQDQVEQNCNCTLPPPVPPPTMAPTLPPVPPPTFPPVLFPFWLSPLYPPRPPPYLWPTFPPVVPPTTAPTSTAPVTLVPVVAPTLLPVLNVSTAPATPTSPSLGPASAVPPTSLPTVKTPVTSPPVSLPAPVTPTPQPTFKAPYFFPPSPSPTVRGSLILGPKKVARKSSMSKLSSGRGH